MRHCSAINIKRGNKSEPKTNSNTSSRPDDILADALPRVHQDVCSHTGPRRDVCGPRRPRAPHSRTPAYTRDCGSSDAWDALSGPIAPSSATASSVLLWTRRRASGDATAPAARTLRQRATTKLEGRWLGIRRRTREAELFKSAPQRSTPARPPGRRSSAVGQPVAWARGRTRAELGARAHREAAGGRGLAR